jgi:predicted cupin superfamily sugar epimerase
MTPADVKALLGLVPHPREGGFYIRTYQAAEMVELPRYPGPRRTATAIYYLLEPATFSEMHRLQSDEVFHFYAGDAVEMLQLPEGTAGHTVAIGNNLVAGERPQVVVARRVWQGSRLKPGGSWALLGCTVSPGFEFEDYEHGDRAELLGLWPEWAKLIVDLTRT